MFATVDIGSNTARMLIGEYRESQLRPYAYERQITRLAGGYTPESGLSDPAMNRTLAALKKFSQHLQRQNIPCLRAVGTAALRLAANQNDFVTKVLQETGFHIDVIDGDEEARLTTAGVLSVIYPPPENALIFDIGGGSTELILVVAGRIVVQKSYPLGVVRLAEEYSDHHHRHRVIDNFLSDFHQIIQQYLSADRSFEMIGTAGTMTTLAAIHLGMTTYDAQRINNHRLSLSWLRHLHERLESISLTDREKLPGMEPGRGDLILPGAQLVVAIAATFGFSEMKVSDAGLLEGVFLAACCN